MKVVHPSPDVNSNKDSVIVDDINDAANENDKENGSQQRNSLKDNGQDDTTQSEEESSCCCCETVVNGIRHVDKRISALQSLVQNDALNSTVAEDKVTLPHEDHSKSNSSRRFEWEDSSSGAARNAVKKMGYKGKGLGKREDGIEDALTHEDVNVDLQGKKVDALIFSSSITKGINTNGLNKLYEGKTAKIHKFHGRKAHEITEYMPVNIEKDKPKSVVIVASGNGVPTENQCSLSQLEKIVNDVVSSGTLCKDNGVEKVIISSFLPRQSAFYQARRHNLNKMLQSECVAKGFEFIANDNIMVNKHVSDDGVHLNAKGSSLLCKNIVKQLNMKD